MHIPRWDMWPFETSSGLLRKIALLKNCCTCPAAWHNQQSLINFPA